MGLARAGWPFLLGLKCPIIDEWAQAAGLAGPLGTITGTGRQLPPLSSVLYRIISGRRSVLAA